MINEEKYTSQQSTGKRCLHTSFFTEAKKKIIEEDKNEAKVREQVK